MHITKEASKLVKEAQKITDNMLLLSAVEKSNELSIKERAAIRHAARTPEQVEAISTAWHQRQVDNVYDNYKQLLAKYGGGTLKGTTNAIRGLGDAYRATLVDLSSANITAMKEAYAKVEKALRLESIAKARHAARTPEQIAGVKIKWNNNRVAQKLGIKQGKAMTFEQANALRGNPMFGTSVDYSINCQSCVVANELRRRGFDVQAFGRMYEEQNLIAIDATLAWIDPKTGVKSMRQYAGITSSGVVTKAQQIQDLNNFTKEEGRYTIGIAWTKNRGRHIITAERLKDGELVFYDPQCGRKYSYSEWIANEYNPDVSKKKDIRIQRIDNLLVNISIIKNIVKGV